MVEAKKPTAKKAKPAAAPAAPATPATDDRGIGRSLKGVVKSNRMAKTITVEVVRTVRHGQYNKFVKQRSRYYAHDENQIANIGDTVIIVESRPLSRLKRWRLREVSEKAKV